MVILTVVLVAVGLMSGLNKKVDRGESVNEQLAGSNPISTVSSSDVQTRYAQVQGVDGEIRWPLSTFDDGQAHYYSFVDTGQSVDFFILKSSDGVVRAALDACDVCFAARKGYHQEGDLMICNNCGRQFPSVRINEERGGCNPAPLERRVKGSDLVIQSSDIVAGGHYF